MADTTASVHTPVAILTSTPLVPVAGAVSSRFAALAVTGRARPIGWLRVAADDPAAAAALGTVRWP